jgi:flavodoxin
MMDTLVVYFSKYGNTKKVAETIADECKPNGTVRVLSLDDLALENLHGVDLLIMGCPTHRMNMPEGVRAKFESMPKRVLKGRPVAAFDTSYKMNCFLSQMTASKKVAHKLRKMGGKWVVPPETFHVMEAEGPLYEGELERARTWTRMVLQKTGN